MEACFHPRLKNIKGNCEILLKIRNKITVVKYSHNYKTIKLKLFDMSDQTTFSTNNVPS